MIRTRALEALQESSPGMLPGLDACRAIRASAQLSMRDLAGAIGTTSPVISNWENGIRIPSAAARVAYARALQDLCQLPEVRQALEAAGWTALDILWLDGAP